MRAKTYIEKELNGFKGFLFAAIAVAFLVDLFVIISLAVSGINAVYFIVPAVMLVLDVVYFITALVSNFRFRYSLVYTVFYAICVTVLWVVYLLEISLLNETQFITFMATALFAAVHVLSAVAVVFSALSSAKVGKGVKILSLAVLVIFAAFSVFYSYFIFKDGFSGQGFTVRTVSYVYDSSTDSYTVAGYAGNKGNVAVIGETFNGKKVSKIDCAIFSDTVTDITINASGCEFVNLAALKNMNTDLKIKISENDVDGVKSELYQAAIDDGYNESIINFANVFEPDTDGVSVTFAYTKESLEILTKAGEAPLATWCGSRGDVFDLNNYSKGYIEHSDINNEEDLYWCYKNFDKKILLSSLTELKTVTSDEKITIEFTDVYKIVFADGNDLLYSMPSETVNLTVGSSVVEGRYVTAYSADKFFNSIPKRDGFSVKYKADGQYIESLSGILKDKNEFTLVPEWKLNSPVISSVSTDKASYCYGDDVTFTTNATAPVSGMSLEYSWKYTGTLVSSEATFQKQNVKPSQSGEYVLTVTASGGNTSLTSEATERITLKVDKKRLSFDWTMPASLVYSGTDKIVACNYRESDTINGDLIEFSTDIVPLINAGNYTFTASLTGECANLYYSDSDTRVKSFVISPYKTAPVWSGSVFTYNGSVQTPSASFNGIGGDELSVMPINVASPDSINVGQYVATATTENGNYILIDNVCNYSISPKTLDVAWIDTELTYNGYSQTPGVELSGIIGDDEVSALIDGEKTDAGEYTAKVIGLTNENYSVVGEPSVSFNIRPLSKEVVWENTSFVYDNTDKLPTVYYYDVFNNRIDLDVAANGDNKNVGTFGATAIAADANYELNNLTKNDLTIEAATLTVAWENTVLTYNGQIQEPTPILSGVMNGDSVEAMVSVAEGEHVNVGDYTASATVSDSNYFLDVNSQTFSIIAKPVDVIWGSLNVLYNGESQKPTAKYINVNGEDVFLAVVTDGDCVNANTYMLNVTSADGNYSLNTESAELTISPAKLELSWSGGNSGAYKFVYCGSVPGVAGSDTLSVAISSGLYGSDMADIAIVLDTNYNVGKYTATASVSNNANYVVSDLSKTCDYEIVAKTVDIIWSATTYQYDGQNHRPVPHYLDISSKTVELGVIGDYQINVGEYSVSAVTIPDGNYTATLGTETCEFTITPAEGTVSWTINNVYYYQDGNEISVSLKAEFECANPDTVLSSDKAGDGVSIEILEGKVINAGEYTAKVTVSNANFTITSGETFAFTVNKKPVGVTFYVNEVERTTDEISANGLTLEEIQNLTAKCEIDSVSASIQFTDEAGIVVDVESLAVGTTYKATAIISDGNYVLNSANSSVTFTVTAA